MAKWEIIEDNKFKKGKGGKTTASRAVTTKKTAAKAATNAAYATTVDAADGRRDLVLNSLQNVASDADNAFWTKYDKSNETNTYVNDTNKIKLNTGRFTGANVPSTLIDDLASAANKNNIPVGQMLALAGRESTFGIPTKYSNYANKAEYVSGWNVSDQYTPYNLYRFLADKKVPGIKTLKSTHGWGFIPEDKEKIIDYTKTHPELIDEYKSKIAKTLDVGDKNVYDLAAIQLKNKGIQSYNPSDPNYVKMFQKDYDSLKQDKNLMDYLQKKGYDYENVTPQKSSQPVVLSTQKPGQSIALPPQFKIGGKVSGWEIIEDNKFKKQGGGKAAASRTVPAKRTAVKAAATPNNLTIITPEQKEKAIENYDEAYKWTSDYMNSPMYKKMLTESSANTREFDNIDKTRWSNFQSIPPLQILPQPRNEPNTGGTSLGFNGQVQLFPYGFGAKAIYSHELSHSTDRPVEESDSRIIPQSDKNYISQHVPTTFEDSPMYATNKSFYDLLKKNKPKEYKKEAKDYKKFHINYVGQDTETRARLNAIRQGAQQNNLYDPFKEGVTPELYYDKLKNFKFEKEDKSGADPMYQLKNVYSDEEIMYMLNHISENKKENDGTELDNLPKAKNGGKVSGWEIIDDIPKAEKGLAVGERKILQRPTQPVQEKSVIKSIPTTVKPQYKSEGDYLNQVYGEDSGVQLPGQSSILRASQDAKPAYDVAKQDYSSYNKEIQEQKTAEQKPKADIVNIQKKLNDLKKEQDSMSSLNGGLGPSNFFDMLKQRDRAQEMGVLESKYQDQLQNTPIIDKADAVGTIMLTAGKYFAPPLRKAIDYGLNIQDVGEFYNHPTDTLNQASVASDVLSYLKSKKTGKNPFGYVGDAITLKQKLDLFNNASKQTYKHGGIIEDPMGQWAHPGSVTRIPSNQITMQGVNYPVLGISDRGHTQMMYPGEDYSFRGKSVTEYPMMQGGGATYAELKNQILNTRLPATNRPTLNPNFNRSTSTTSPLSLQALGKKDYGVSLNKNGLNLSAGLNLEGKNPAFRAGVDYGKGNWSGSANYSTDNNNFGTQVGYNNKGFNAGAGYQRNNDNNSFNTNAGYSNSGFNVGAGYQRNNNNNSFNANVGYDGDSPVNFNANYAYDKDHSFDTNVGLNLGRFSGGLNYGYNQEGDRAHNFGANANLGLGKNLNVNADANFDSNKNYQVNAGLKYNFQDGGRYTDWKNKYDLQETSDYNLQRAFELGYVPDETGHLPSVDSETGEWLKSDTHPTRGMEMMESMLNPDVANNLRLIRNEKGKMQYIPKSKYGGEVNFTYAGENHRVYEKESPTGNGKGIEGHIMVNHPTKNKGKWDTIDLTKITNGKVKTVAQGVASTKKWHKENPEYANGGQVSSWEIIEDLPKAQTGILTPKDSLYHQRDKTIKYDLLRGHAQGTPLPQYSNTAHYNQFYKDSVEPKLKYYPTAMEKGDAGDFIFNAGKDPRIFAYQEYLRKTDPTNKTGWADVDNKWKDRKNLPPDFDQIYQNTIGKLPENERRVAINNGRDWYYKNTWVDDNDKWKKGEGKEEIVNGKTAYRAPDGSLSSAYGKTWYGRIWNNNDFKEFDPNNPKFTPPAQKPGQSVALPPQFQKGGKTNIPIYVNDPKDPRLQMYSDSLYNSNLTKNISPVGYNLQKTDLVSSTPIKPTSVGTAIYPNNVHGNMKPSHWDNYVTGVGFDKNSPEYSVARFTPPTQPYILKLQDHAQEQINMPTMGNINSSQQIAQQISQPIINIPTVIPPKKDYVTIKTGSSYRNPETGAFQQKSFKIDKGTGKKVSEETFKNGGKTKKSSWQIIEY